MLKRRTEGSSSNDHSVQFQSQMEHAGPCSNWLGNGRTSFRNLLMANHFGDSFQSWDIQELASGGGGMSAEHLFLAGRWVFAGIASFENIVGKRNQPTRHSVAATSYCQGLSRPISLVTQKTISRIARDRRASTGDVIWINSQRPLTTPLRVFSSKSCSACCARLSFRCVSTRASTSSN